MKKLKLYMAGAMAAAAIAVPAANAATPQVIGAGSSALWQTAAIGAFRDLAGAGAHHYTIKGACGVVNCAQLFDSRSSSIALQSGNLWVVWTADQSKVWTYLSVDSVVGNRSFFAVPRAKLQLAASLGSTAGQNLISPSLWGNDATGLPSAIYSSLNNQPLTAAFTDIRPEDAKFAETRAVSTLGEQPQDGLGYGTGPNTLVGTEIKSTYSTSFAQPVNFNLSGGTDPFNGSRVPPSVTIPVGATPVVFFINRTNPNGLGKAGVPGNTLHQYLQLIFSGDNCSIDGVPVTAILREPISGTMNTAEFTEFQGLGGGQAHSQENNVNEQNPLNKACSAGGGKRTRAIGTGEEVSSVTSSPDSIGYAFFGFGNFSKIANNNGYHYLEVDGVDPIHSSYSTGLLPACTAPCPSAPNTTFPNLRNGSYKSWSVLRVVTDASGNNRTTAQALVTATQNNINKTVPDFVPYVATTDGDAGLQYYRSHFTQSGVSPNNGLSGQTESGGDVGGCIERKGPAPGVLGCHQ